MGNFTIQSEQRRIAGEAATSDAHVAAVLAAKETAASDAAFAAAATRAKFAEAIEKLKALEPQTPEIVADIAKLEVDLAAV